MATLASAHFLFTSVLAAHHGVVEFATKSGILTAKKVPAPETEEQGKLFIELDFPASDFVGSGDELPSIPETLNGASVVSVHKSVTTNDFIIRTAASHLIPVRLPFSVSNIAAFWRIVSDLELNHLATLLLYKPFSYVEQLFSFVSDELLLTRTTQFSYQNCSL
jgi:hypothetical protein